MKRLLSLSAAVFLLSTLTWAQDPTVVTNEDELRAAVPTDIDQTPFPSGEGRGEAWTPTKYLQDGLLLIERDEKIYDIMGIRIK